MAVMTYWLVSLCYARASLHVGHLSRRYEHRPPDGLAHVLLVNREREGLFDSVAVLLSPSNSA